MAVPKKKSSKSRRNMRRFASGNLMAVPTGTNSVISNEFIRQHTVTLSTVDAYVAKRAADKTKRKSASKSA